MLNHLFKKILAFSLMLLPLQASAEYLQNHRIKLGLEGAYYHYVETHSYSGKQLMRAQGPLLGVNAEYYHDYNSKYFIDIDARALVGVENYDGSLWNGTPHSTGYTTLNALFEARIMPGLKVDNFHFYSGLGYRLKADAPFGIDRHAYPRQSQYIYIPLGAKMPTTYQDVALVPYLEYDLFLAGMQTTNFSCFGGPKMYNAQKEGFGIKTGVVIKLEAFDLVPYVNYWHIGDSERDFLGYEPQNTTWEIGLKVNFAF